MISMMWLGDMKDWGLSYLTITCLRILCEQGYLFNNDNIWIWIMVSCI